MQDWFETPAGRYLLAWEQAQFDNAVADIFGYHALQLGLPALATLQANRMSHRWLATTHETPGFTTALRTDYAALPFPQASLDLVTLPHALDSHTNPHATLREVARVLLPGGRVVLSGFNPASLWGLHQRREQLCRRLNLSTALLPEGLGFMSYWRMRDWLHLLDFEIEHSCYGAYRPLLTTEAWLRRWRWADAAGARWWPFLGAAYLIVAVKRVHGMRLIGAAWKRSGSKAVAAVPLARRDGPATLLNERNE